MRMQAFLTAATINLKRLAAALAIQLALLIQLANDLVVPRPVGAMHARPA